MGQKVNPHGMRVGVIKDWDSRWYAEADFADNLIEDHDQNIPEKEIIQRRHFQDRNRARF